MSDWFDYDEDELAKARAELDAEMLAYERRLRTRVRRWLCRHGFHGDVFTDAAMFTMADRCGHCLEYLDPVARSQLEAERAYWSSHPIPRETP